MKAIIFLLAILTLVYSQIENSSIDEIRGCVINEKEGKCCWRNNNGCCEPPKKGQMCTMAFRTCCKTKTYDETTGTFKYTYN